MPSAAEKLMSLDEFLAWERGQPERYEFDGMVAKLVTGGSLDHSTIASNLHRALSIMLRASGCMAFRGDAKVRFHAFQGLYLFVAWLIVDWVLSPLLGFQYWGPPFYKIVPVLMKVAVFGAWVFMIIKTAQDEMYKLPILGELAEKSVSEQR